jgi:hypothetical protein
VSENPSRGFTPTPGPDEIRADSARFAALAGVVAYLLGVGVLLLESVHCAFENTGCGAGGPLVAIGACAFVLAAVLACLDKQVATALLLLAGGLLSAILLHLTWATSGPGTALSMLPACAATVTAWKRNGGSPTMPSPPDSDT